MKNVTLLSLSLPSLQPLLPQIPPPLYCTLTYQDGGDYVSSVLQAVGLVAASHEAGGGHVLFIFIPVANLIQEEYVINQGLYFIRLQFKN